MTPSLDREPLWDICEEGGRGQCGGQTGENSSKRSSHRGEFSVLGGIGLL